MAKIYQVALVRDGRLAETRPLNTRALIAFLATVKVGDKLRMERVQ